MDKVAALPAQDRGDLFTATADAMHVHPAIIEKDFWVCWVLQKLFTSNTLHDQLVFKGGTSLSKVYGLIARFSEDIDLVLNWELLGYGRDGDDPWTEQSSRTKQDRFNKRVNIAAAEYLTETLQPQLVELFTSVPSVRPVMSDDDPMAIYIHYPAAFELRAIRPQVKLEIGPLASWVPSQRRIIKPYAAEHFPAVFDAPECPVVAITAERTFWEKATILHQQAHRDTPMPPAYSRHYYDLHQLAGSPVRAAALSDLQLLEDVVTFKQRFYPCGWARYEDAKPGTFRLLPTKAGELDLAEDYQKMRAMIFREPPPWDAVLDSLRDLEQEINAPAGGGFA